LALVPLLAVAAGFAAGWRLGDQPAGRRPAAADTAPRPAPGRLRPPLWERVATAPDAAACAARGAEVAAVASRSDRERWQRLLFAVWCQHDGPGAYAAVAGRDDAAALAGLVQEWALADPDAAAAAVAGRGEASGTPSLEAALTAGLAAGHPERFFARGRNQDGFGPNLRRAALALAARDPAVALTQLETLGDDPYGKLARDVAAGAVATVWGRSEPSATTAWALRAVEGGTVSRELLDWLVEAVSNTDPQAAAALLAKPDLGTRTLRPPAPPRREGDLRAPVPPDPFAAVGRGLVSRSPYPLAEALGQLDGAARDRVAVGAAAGLPAGAEAELVELFDSAARVPGGDGLPGLMASAWAGGDAPSHSHVLARLAPSPGRDALLGVAVARWAEADAEAAAGFMRALLNPGDRALAGAAALDRPGLWARGGDVVLLFEASGLARLPSRFAGLLPDGDFAPVAEAAERQGDREAVDVVTARWVRRAPAAAARWAAAGDPSRRPARLRSVFTAWADADPDLARAEFAALELSEGERELVEKEADW
jgi:hypothetical protein